MKISFQEEETTRRNNLPCVFRYHKDLDTSSLNFSRIFCDFSQYVLPKKCVCERCVCNRDIYVPNSVFFSKSFLKIPKEVYQN